MTLQVRHYRILSKAGRAALDGAASAALLLLLHRFCGHAAAGHMMHSRLALFGNDAWLQPTFCGHLPLFAPARHGCRACP